MIWRITATDQRAYIYIDTHTAFVVPLRAFVSRQEFEDFIDLARRYRKEARKAAPQPDLEPPARQPPSIDITRDVNLS